LITIQARRAAFTQIEQDLRDGLLLHLPIAWSNICRRADELSERHSLENSQRALDLLHVASALESGISLFISFDQRQRGLAQAAGLKVNP
jgi:predicted nucleic acid-binding protein